MDIERLPSGKSATNALILACSVLIYNILRWIGQTALTGLRSPKRHKAKRRHIKTVMQDMMNIAARVVKIANRIKLSFGNDCC
jgi:IS30 family transposase